jgi:hypothetical protein
MCIGLSSECRPHAFSRRSCVCFFPPGCFWPGFLWRVPVRSRLMLFEQGRCCYHKVNTSINRSRCLACLGPRSNSSQVGCFTSAPARFVRAWRYKWFPGPGSSYIQLEGLESATDCGASGTLASCPLFFHENIDALPAETTDALGARVRLF